MLANIGCDNQTGQLEQPIPNVYQPLQINEAYHNSNILMGYLLVCVCVCVCASLPGT